LGWAGAPAFFIAEEVVMEGHWLAAAHTQGEPVDFLIKKQTVVNSKSDD
jgi:hypothetical protein